MGYEKFLKDYLIFVIFWGWVIVGVLGVILLVSEDKECGNFVEVEDYLGKVAGWKLNWQIVLVDGANALKKYFGALGGVLKLHLIVKALVYHGWENLDLRIAWDQDVRALVAYTKLLGAFDLDVDKAYAKREAVFVYNVCKLGLACVNQLWVVLDSNLTKELLLTY